MNSGELVTKLFAAAHVVGAQVAADLVETGVTLGEAHLLSLMDRSESTPLIELQHRSGNRASSLGSMVDRLEQRGLAVRRRSSTDRRAVTIELTDAGRDLAHEIEAVFAAAEDGLVARGVDLDPLGAQLAAVIDGHEEE